MFFSLFADLDDIPTFGGIVFPPLFVFVLGLAGYLVLSLRFADDARFMWPRRVAAGLVALSFLMAMHTMLQLTGSLGAFYRASIASNFTLMAHFIMPVLTLAALAYVGWSEKRLASAAA